MSLYVLFYMALWTPRSRTVTVSPITAAIFDELHRKHPDTLLCPCSNGTVSYTDFLTNITIFHPVCSSIFVDPEWIRALYLPNASTYGLGDFRTTAFSQVNQYLFKKPCFHQK